MIFFLTLCKAILRKISTAIFCIFPIDEKTVVFDNFNGGGFGCNPKYIAQALKNSGLKLIWLVHSPRSGQFPSYIIPIKYDSLRAWYYLETAKVFVSNVRNSKGIVKRAGQKYLQTWHASLGPKMIEKDAECSLSSSYIRQAKQNGIDTDLMFANNVLMEKIFKTAFWYSGEVIRCGIPRNTCLINCSNWDKDRLKNKLGLPLDSLVCLYAPTWRNVGYKIPLFDFEKCMQVLKQRFNKDITFCIRFHPNSNVSEYELTEDIVDLSKYPDAQELLGVVDILISDYSSIMEDFVFTERPAFMFIPDYDSYIKDRQFYYSLSRRPYPICKTEDELWSEIRSFSEIKLKERIDGFKKEFDICEDGSGSICIANIIQDWCKN